MLQQQPTNVGCVTTALAATTPVAAILVPTEEVVRILQEHNKQGFLVFVGGFFWGGGMH